MTSLILAAGEQARWEKDHSVRFKQLLPVCGEPVLHRIVRQVSARAKIPFIVTHRDELEYKDALTYRPINRRWTCETMFSTIGLWRKRTTILLGDTAYSRTVMDRIYACQEPIRVFGNEYEIYAISFDQYSILTVAEYLIKAIRHAEDGGPGTLRMFYEALCHFQIGCGRIESKLMDRVCYIQDYTKDLDTPNDYTNFLNKWERKGLVDDTKG